MSVCLHVHFVPTLTQMKMICDLYLQSLEFQKGVFQLCTINKKALYLVLTLESQCMGGGLMVQTSERGFWNPCLSGHPNDWELDNVKLQGFE